jgi:hypothetical protein
MSCSSTDTSRPIAVAPALIASTWASSTSEPPVVLPAEPPGVVSDP